MMNVDPVTLVFIGAALVFLGIAVMVLTSREGRVEGGAVIVVGPIPIVIGSSRSAAVAAALVGAAAVIALLLISLVVR